MCAWLGRVINLTTRFWLGILGADSGMYKA